jgi:hypothetical protein
MKGWIRFHHRGIDPQLVATDQLVVAQNPENEREGPLQHLHPQARPDDRKARVVRCPLMEFVLQQVPDRDRIRSTVCHPALASKPLNMLRHDHLEGHLRIDPRAARPSGMSLSHGAQRVRPRSPNRSPSGVFATRVRNPLEEAPGTSFVGVKTLFCYSLWFFQKIADSCLMVIFSTLKYNQKAEPAHGMAEGFHQADPPTIRAQLSTIHGGDTGGDTGSTFLPLPGEWFPAVRK